MVVTNTSLKIPESKPQSGEALPTVGPDYKSFHKFPRERFAEVLKVWSINHENGITGLCNTIANLTAEAKHQARSAAKMLEYLDTLDEWKTKRAIALRKSDAARALLSCCTRIGEFEVWAQKARNADPVTRGVFNPTTSTRYTDTAALMFTGDATPEEFAAMVAACEADHADLPTNAIDSEDGSSDDAGRE